MAASVRSHSVITCPACGASAGEQMPTDACLFFYECKQCRTLLRPKSGDCCVFCSYGSVKCPPVQLEKGCCG
ncbi:MAG TPA: GDCCVxC domain-containing (seleno)protein [Longimicrobiales bacterium]